MRIRRVDRKIEKDILIGMITDKRYLSTIRPACDLRFFKSGVTKTVAKWILDYYDKFSDAPGSNIQKIYDYNERQGNIEEDDVDLIKNLLQEAADQYAECPNLNSDFLVVKTEEYFNRVNMELIFAESSELMQKGDVEKAKELVYGSVPIRIGETSASDGLTNTEEIQQAFETTGKPLFRLPGHIGKLIGAELCRDRFLALQAPEKTGKTWFLMWMALRALRARLKVVLFEFEMTKGQVNRRLSITISGKSDMRKYCNISRAPTKFSADGEDTPGLPGGVGVLRNDFDLGEPLTWQEALSENEKFYKRFRLKKDKHWRLVTAPARSMNMKQINAELDRLATEEDFVADVVLIDYMDILAPENPREEERARINSNWIAAKAMTNERHCLTISVTQANANSYNMELQTRSNFSEDHRKYAHTNGTLGLTQTPEDKKHGIAKLNWLVLREGDWTENDVCFILQNLKRGKFCVDSMMKEEWERQHHCKLGKAVKKAEPEKKPEYNENKPKKSFRSTRERGR